MTSGKMMSFFYLTWDIPIQTTFLTFSHEPSIVGGCSFLHNDLLSRRELFSNSMLFSTTSRFPVKRREIFPNYLPKKRKCTEKQI